MVVPAEQLADLVLSTKVDTEAEQLDVQPTFIKGCKVLVVEDETLIALQIEEALEAIGCEVVGPFATVADALSNLRTGTPDAAILDMNLAGEKSDRVAQALTALDVPFLYCTGYADAAKTPGAAGSYERLTKPLDPKLLTAALARLVSSDL
jgi:DNA-binding NtrC family response regulator